MVSTEFASGDKTLGVIIGPKYYNFKQFIGSNFGIPLKAYEPEVAKRMLAISTFERLDQKKLKKNEILEQCLDILENCSTLGITVLLVANSEYFKLLAGQKSLEENIGGVFTCCIPEYTGIKVLPCINPAVINAQPNKKGLLDKAIEVCGKVLAGTYEKPQEFKFESYELITNTQQAKAMLNELKQKEILAVDIETTGLRLGEAEILTIAFAYDKYNAVTFVCHHQYDAEDIIPVLKEFFEGYEGESLYHNCLFDLKHLIYNWWMKDFSDLAGLYAGCKALGVDRVQDSMLLAYAELNSTDRPSLGLKVLSKEFLGDYAEDVTNASEVDLEALAVYNAKDVCGTFYVYEKYKHQRTSRGYLEILQPSIEPLLHMMINGLPINLEKVKEASTKIVGELDKALEVLKTDSYVAQTIEVMKNLLCMKYNDTHKKQKEPYEIEFEFNPSSSNQLRVLLYDVIGFDPIEFTDKGAPKTDRASLKEFKSMLAEGDDKLETLNALQAVSETAIIQNTFLAAFTEMSLPDDEDNYTLHGDLRLGGTQSARLSSSNPNLQNIPSGSTYGKIIKSCFVAPEGWLFAFADFSSLEDKIGAILSGDVNKTREFTENIDGHSMRAAAFFKDELEDRGIQIDMLDPNSINRVKDEAPDIRNKSKAPSFGMQYGCAAPKLQKMLKCSMSKAEEVYSAFHTLYSGLGEFTKRNEEFAKKNGYIELAFGIRLQTPKINSKDRSVQSAETRSASNAATQSYGQLMNRAFIAVHNRLKASEHMLDIKVISTIHDAAYYLVRKDTKAIKWLNDNLINAMEWQEDPVLKSDVKIGAELDLGLDWGHCKTLNNNASLVDIQEFLDVLQTT